MKELAVRYAAFTFGLYLLGLAISLIVVSSLGTTPISSLNYVISLNTPLSLGMATFAFNMVIILIQFWLLRGGLGSKKDYLEILMQIPFSLLFSAFIDINMSMVGSLHPSGYLWRVGVLLLGCLVQAVAVVIELRSNVVIMSAEGVVKYASRRYNQEFGKMKVRFDVVLVLLAVGCSLAMSGHIDGVREGTVIAAVLTGTLVSFIVTRIVNPLHLRQRIFG